MNKKIRICRGISIIEKKRIRFKKVECDGLIEDEGDKVVIFVKKSLSDEAKLLIVFHELCHWIQHRKEEKYSDEKIAKNFEKLVYLLFKQYLPVVNGALQIFNKEEEKKNEKKS